MFLRTPADEFDASPARQRVIVTWAVLLLWLIVFAGCGCETLVRPGRPRRPVSGHTAVSPAPDSTATGTAASAGSPAERAAAADVEELRSIPTVPAEQIVPELTQPHSAP